MPSHLQTLTDSIRANSAQKQSESIALNTEAALIAETEVVRLLSEAQQQLKAGRLDNALIKLRAARDARIHPEYMTNQALTKDEFFDESIKLLTDEIETSNAQKIIGARVYAEMIMHEALKNFSGDSSLFEVHKERMIVRMTTGIQLNWHKFYGQNFTQDLDIVRKMSELIASDLTKNDCNKMLFRGGFMAQFQLLHSQTLGDVLQAMLQLEPVATPFQSYLPIFEQTKTVVENFAPQEPDSIYDWNATLEFWPTLVVKAASNTCILDDSEESRCDSPGSHISTSSYRA